MRLEFYYNCLFFKPEIADILYFYNLLFKTFLMKKLISYNKLNNVVD